MDTRRFQPEFYFGTRNGIELKPILNIHYDAETLKKSIPSSLADKFTRLLVSKMPLTARPFTVFETCGGIGSYTLALADNPSINRVYTFEQDNKMLKQTIKDYQLSSKIGVGEKFGLVSKDYAGSVVFINCDLVDGKFNGYTIEQWLAALPYMAIVVIKDYEPKPVPGYRYEKEGQYTFAISERGIADAEKKGVSQYQKIADERLEKMDSIEWWKQFQLYIYNLLGRIIPNDQDRLPYVMEEPMKVWAKAFTHETFDRDFNYEQLETLGDRALEFVFSRYLIKRYPDITSEQITQLKRAYMSKGEYGKQPELARKVLKVAPYLRHLGLNITESMYEDVFESFFGALFDVSDRFVKEGLGYVNAYNMIASLFNELGIDLALATESEKSLVHIRFSQMGWGQKPIETIETTPKGIKFIIRLTPSAIEYFKSKRIDINPIIGEAEARIQSTAENLAFKQALETLNRYGIQPDKIAEEREKALARDRVIGPYLARLKGKLRDMGYEDFEFFTSKTTAAFGAYLVQLYGVKRDKTKKLLRSTIASSEEKGEENLLKSFVESN